MKLIFSILGFVTAASAQGQVFKCVDASGRTAYQAQPCPGGTALRIDPGPAAINDSERARITRAIARGQLAVGMTPAQVRYVRGAPDSINASTRNDGTFDQWVYRRGDDTDYVYLRNGLVSSFSQDRRVVNAEPAPATQSSPSHQIAQPAKGSDPPSLPNASMMTGSSSGRFISTLSSSPNNTTAPARTTSVSATSRHDASPATASRVSTPDKPRAR